MSASSSTPPPALPVVSPSAVVSVSAAASSSSALAAVESLSSEVEQQLTLQSPAPSSSKAIRFPDRPGYGVTGRKIKVRANHFKVDVVEKDLHHYDVSS
jgi:eukaryotic translation initiation factor 2C